MTERSDFAMRIEALGKALFLGQELASSHKVVFFAVAYDVENGAVLTVEIVYVDRDGYAARGEFTLDRQRAFVELWEATLDLGPQQAWATFEIIVDIDGRFEVSILYPEQTDLNDMRNLGVGYFSFMAGRHFPNVPLRPTDRGLG